MVSTRWDSLRRVKQRGFTMVELLVVIAIIAILAVAVLAAINPIEQINKGRDTRSRADASEVVNASERYFATQEQFPWNAGGASTPASEFFMNETGADAWINELANAEEVKPQFVARFQNGNKHVVYKPAGELETIYSCFLPVSKAMQLEAERRCTPGDALYANYTAGSSFNPCTSGSSEYLCLP